MTPPWVSHAADLGTGDPDDDGNPIYPSRGSGSAAQATQSAYHGRHYDAGPGVSQYLRRVLTIEEEDTEAAHAKMIAELVYYIMVKMEPTDRCLRMPGDVFDYKRLNSQGLELPEPGCDG